MEETMKFLNQLKRIADAQEAQVRQMEVIISQWERAYRLNLRSFEIYKMDIMCRWKENFAPPTPKEQSEGHEASE
jgi:hypothetical protein